MVYVYVFEHEDLPVAAAARRRDDVVVVVLRPVPVAVRRRLLRELLTAAELVENGG